MSLTLVLAVGYLACAAVLAANVRYFRATRSLGHPLPAPAPSVSVVIPARNERHNLPRLLPGLLAQSYPDFEVIVYDDRSDDGTWEWVSEVAHPRLRLLRGGDVPPGWIGKTYALDQATRDASGTLLLFLDADVDLTDPEALGRLVRRYLALPKGSVLSGITHLDGGGRLLVSLVPFVMLTHLPLRTATTHPSAHLTGMNGQCWMIDRAAYDRLRPHRRHRGDVLEDVRIGRYLKSEGLCPHLLDLQGEVRVRMYDSLGSAWVGFRKNVYPFLGETPLRFALGFGSFVAFWVLGPLLSPWYLLAAYLLKTGTDRLARMPIWVSALTPVTFVLGAALQIDSAVAHWTGRATWKGRPVSRRSVQSEGHSIVP